MTSRINEEFRRRLSRLPPPVRRQAREAYRRWAADPYQRGLRFKPVHARQSLWSVRVSLAWRAVGSRTGDTITWFWIGSHADYDALLRQL